MRDWFKARNAWGKIFQTLPDEQAGQLAKALWSFTADGIIPECDGYIGGLFAMMQITLNDDLRKEAEISAKRAAAGAAGGNQKAANQANGSNCYQMPASQANVGNKNKKEIEKEETEKETETESDFITDEDARDIQNEQDRVLNAAEDAGFQRTNSVRAQLIHLYAEYGLEKLLYGIDACVIHGAPNLAYLRAVLNGNPKQEKPVKVLPAQDFPQRSYDGVNEELMQQLKDEVDEYRREHPNEEAGA